MKLKSLILEFFRNNPEPSDQEVHALAKSLGLSYEKLEECIYDMFSSFLEKCQPHKEFSNSRRDKIDLFLDNVYQDLAYIDIGLGEFKVKGHGNRITIEFAYKKPDLIKYLSPIVNKALRDADLIARGYAAVKTPNSIKISTAIVESETASKAHKFPKNKADLKRYLEKEGINFKEDFHQLNSTKQELLLDAAIAAKYRKPASASGSRARYFFSHLQKH